jgi:hypothetical protein
MTMSLPVGVLAVEVLAQIVGAWAAQPASQILLVVVAQHPDVTAGETVVLTVEPAWSDEVARLTGFVVDSPQLVAVVLAEAFLVGDRVPGWAVTPILGPVVGAQEGQVLC